MLEAGAGGKLGNHQVSGLEIRALTSQCRIHLTAAVGLVGKFYQVSKRWGGSCWHCHISEALLTKHFAGYEKGLRFVAPGIAAANNMP